MKSNVGDLQSCPRSNLLVACFTPSFTTAESIDHHLVVEEMCVMSGPKGVCILVCPMHIKLARSVCIPDILVCAGQKICFQICFLFSNILLTAFLIQNNAHSWSKFNPSTKASNIWKFMWLVGWGGGGISYINMKTTIIIMYGKEGILFLQGKKKRYN